jgi:DNA-binding transcriptional LysR family regulator
MRTPDLEHVLLSRLRLRHIRQLSAVGRLGSVSRAAETLHVSQPALSKSIHEVEALLDMKLFERTARGLVPTVAGERLLQHCRAVESELCKAGEDLQALVSGTGGQVTVGAYLVALPQLIPLAISRLMAEAPDVTVRILDGGARQLLAALQAGDADFIVGRIHDAPPGETVVHEVLYEEPIRVIASPAHPLARQRRVAYRDLCGYPWVIPAPDSAAYVPVMDLFLRQGLPRPRMCVESTSFLMIRTLLQEQPALAAMPHQVIERDVALGVLRVLPVRLPYPPLPVGITRHAARQPGPAAQRFIDALRAIAPGKGAKPMFPRPSRATVRDPRAG